MLYPVIFWPGSFGSVVCHFINMHDNYYSISPVFTLTKDNNIARQMDGPLHITDNNDDLYINEVVKLSDKETNELKKYNMAVKVFPRHDDLIKQSNAIAVIPNIVELESRINSNTLNKERKIPTKNEITDWLHKVKELNYYQLPIDDFWSWADITDCKYTETYLDFCKFLNTVPRPTVGTDISRIKYFVKDNT